MRIPIPCMPCGDETDLYFEDVQDAGIYHLVCAKGHKTVVRDQSLKFEILFEIALHATVDGYYREAVASFAASLERYYEFYLRVIWAQKGLQMAAFETAWKRLSNQSERQLGAYSVTYLMENGSAAPQLTDKQSTFRNGVIHKGQIPSRAEAIDFGQSVLDIVSPTLKYLQQTANEAVQTVFLANFLSSSELENTQSLVTMSLGNTLSCTRAPGEPQVTVNDAVVRLAKVRERRVRSAK